MQGVLGCYESFIKEAEKIIVQDFFIFKIFEQLNFETLTYPPKLHGKNIAVLIFNIIVAKKYNIPEFSVEDTLNILKQEYKSLSSLGCIIFRKVAGHSN